ncbi:MAG: hypothetical protein KC645_02720 [Gemmatimonadetes bacterium]|nr:hypothetical protein [Gemmatimonadota bacterium]
MPKLDTRTLLTQAIDVVNRSLSANRDHGLYGLLIRALDDHMEGRTWAVAVYDGTPDQREGKFGVRYEQNRFGVVDQVPDDDPWNASREYLQNLVDEPETYIEHPARMDLDWLTSRLPDSVAGLANFPNPLQ